jgi:hypothetical protein
MTPIFIRLNGERKEREKTPPLTRAGTEENELAFREGHGVGMA